jgi:ATP-dependent helicase/nuclease subunit B
MTSDIKPNIFIQNLARICSEHFLDEKYLLAPSLRVGNQWVEQVTRSGQPVVNLRVTTLLSLALQLLSASVKDITLLPHQAQELLVDRIWCELSKDQIDPYLATVEFTPGFLSRLAATIADLRAAGVTAKQMDAGSFEVSAKGREVSALYDACCREFEKLNVYDSARVLAEAVSLAALNEDTLVLLPSFLYLPGLEGRFLEAFPADRVLKVPGETGEDLPGIAAGDNGLTISFATALGETAEVRSIFNRCLDRGLLLDQVEVVYSDQETYLPLLFEESVRLTRHQNTALSDPPVTFADGIPTRFTRPGRALMAWVDWIREGYPQPLMVSMVRNGLLVSDEKVSASHMAQALRSLPIGRGRDRYLKALDSRIWKLTREISESVEDTEELEGKRRDRTADLAALKELKSVTAKLIGTCPAPSDGTDKVLEKAASFLTTLARDTNRWDAYALEKFNEKIGELSHWYKASTEPCILDPFDWLREMARDERVGGSGPRPGCLHASRVSAGGHTGRPYTFIIGMDDSRHPGAGLQDPVLLDRERAGISEDLPTASDRLIRRTEDFRGAIARLRGELVLSYPCLDLAEDRELFPAAVVVEVMRFVTGEPEAQAERLKELAGTPAAFTPAPGASYTDETQWWLQRLLTGDKPEDALETVHAAFPHLAARSDAVISRLGDSLTPFDGLIALDPRHDPLDKDGPAMSATRLETIGRCPLSYFFAYLLHVSALEDPGAQREVWLEPLHFGSLLHDVLYRFMNHVMEKGETPSEAAHADVMDDIAAQEAQRYREKYPPPDDTLYSDQVEKLARAVRVFLQDEEEAAGLAAPFLLEQGVGLDGGAEPVAIRLPGGVTIRSRGRIDRIDRLAAEANRFTITDYKSGSAYRYDIADPFKQGRNVQQALYVKLAEKLLKETVGPDAVVEAFRYYFPASRAVDEPVSWDSEALADGDTVLSLLARVCASGAFCATNDHRKDCGYCDYKEVCGDFEAVTKAVKGKLEDDSDTRLDPFRNLRGVNRE